MKLTAFFQHRLRWINLPGALLVALLQRTPVVPVAQLAEEFVLSSPISAILKSSAVLTSLGALHSLAGATTLVTNNHDSPLNVTAGVAIPEVVFGVTGNGASTPGSWEVGASSTIPPGLSFGVPNGSPRLTAPGTLNVSNPSLEGTPTAAGTYKLSLQAWLNPNRTGDTSPIYTYTIIVTTGLPAPTITAQPLSVTVNSGSTVAFVVTVPTAAGASYQWSKNNVPIAGATSDTLILSGTAQTAGSYTVVASNSSGSVTSNAATLAVTSGQVSRISNLSVRTNLASGQLLTVGFVTSAAKNLLLRAIGPSLNAVFGLTGFYPDPKIAVINNAGVTIAQDDDWPSSLSPVFASVGAFALTPNSKDAALEPSITGPNTAQINGTGPGVILVEVYDVDPATAPARLTNVSARNQVGTGANILISGFVVDGSAARTVLIRGIGPALNDVFGVTGQLTDPLLEIHQTINNQDTVIASNDNWNASLTPIFDQVGAYHFNAGSKDSAMLITLPPGVYTAQVSGVNGVTGDGVVEVYDVP